MAQASTPRGIRDRVELVLDRLRPALLADGGNVELLEVTRDGIVRVALQGACITCPAQAATLRLALEPALQREVPGVTALVASPHPEAPLSR